MESGKALTDRGADEGRMKIMAIAGVGYRPNDVYYKHTNSRTGRYAESQAASQAVESGSNINLNWSDGAIFASGTPDGQSFSIYKEDGYTIEKPLMTIKGTDKNGEAYEKQVNPLTVDPTNASYAEMMAVNAYFVDIGELDVNDMGAFERPSEDDLEKADYLTALRQWRDTQYDAGNIVGYHQAANVCNALVNLQQEQNGTEKYITGLSGETVRAVAMEGRLKSGIVGFSSIGQEDGFRLLEARYADTSTSENPIMEVRINKENGESQVFQININDIDPQNASQMEMFALLSHVDAQGISDEGLGRSSYMKYLECADQADMEATNVDDFINQKKDWTQMQDTIASDNTGAEYKWVELLGNLFEQFISNMSDGLSGNGVIMDMVTGENTAPYSYLAKDGVIEYNGVSFNCDYQGNRITLGDVSNPKNCLNIPLSKGGSLMVNVDNLGDLSKAIGMFSPEDIRRIMEAIAQYNKAQEMQQEIEEDTNSLGDSATEDTVAPLVSESTRSTDQTEDVEEKEKLYITWYNEDGIFCREQGQTEGYLWSVPLNGKEEYDKVMSYLSQFDQDENLQFAHDENFWKEFLAGNVKEEMYKKE